MRLVLPRQTLPRGLRPEMLGARTASAHSNASAVRSAASSSLPLSRRASRQTGSRQKVQPTKVRFVHCGAATDVIGHHCPGRACSTSSPIATEALTRSVSGIPASWRIIRRTLRAMSGRRRRPAPAARPGPSSCSSPCGSKVAAVAQPPSFAARTQPPRIVLPEPNARFGSVNREGSQLRSIGGPDRGRPLPLT